MPSAFDTLCIISVLWVSFKVFKRVRNQARTTPLAGPPNPNLLLGAGRFIVKSTDAGNLYEEWSEKYGSVFRIPATLGLSRIALCDPKAIQHFYSRETYGYVQSTMTKRAIESMVCVSGWCLLSVR